ncbi:MAG: Tat pathway signal protein [Clostridia bacterium]|nr:Tat pathway signal protein [Clostridia bacterium]
MNTKIWAYLIHLSYHMWDDENTPPRGWYGQPRYQENNNVSVETWDSVVRYLAECKYNTLVIDVGDAIKYESRPEISAPDAWDKAFLKKKLDEARALGLAPIPKLNFSCAHHTWLKKYRRMVSTPEYYAACADVIREVCEAFGYPRLIHLGMDEEDMGFTMREAYHWRGEKLWWNDLYFYFNEAEKYGARPWVWSDYYWKHSEVFIKNMPKSVLQSNWYYAAFKNYPEGDLRNKRIATYEELDALGYEQIPCMSTCRGFDGAAENHFHTLTHAKRKLDERRVIGFMTAPWSATTALREFYLKDGALALFDARSRVYPETLESF